jgi:hypothetical protein
MYQQKTNKKRKCCEQITGNKDKSWANIKIIPTSWRLKRDKTFHSRYLINIDDLSCLLSRHYLCLLYPTFFLKHDLYSLDYKHININKYKQINAHISQIRNSISNNLPSENTSVSTTKMYIPQHPPKKCSLQSCLWQQKTKKLDLNIASWIDVEKLW